MSIENKKLDLIMEYMQAQSMMLSESINRLYCKVSVDDKDKECLSQSEGFLEEDWDKLSDIESQYNKLRGLK